MRRLIENHFTCVLLCALFALAMLANVAVSGTIPSSPHGVPALVDPSLVAHGPSFPPDPWEGVQVAIGPSFPPDPWEGVSITA